MTVAFNDERDAFLGVLALVIGADQQGSLAERDYLRTEVRGLPLFAGMETADFDKMLGDVTDRLFTAGALAPDQVEAVVAAAGAVLGAEHRAAAVRCATDLCAIDGDGAGENEMLAGIRAHLT
jgi:hypothetical protein